MKTKLLAVCGMAIVFSAKAFTIHIPSDYPTIQQGIGNASNGDTVLVHPGTYVENINFSGKNIVVGSLFLLTGDTSDISSTIISGSPLATVDRSVVTFESGETSSAQLTGLTIRDGGGNYRQFMFEHIFYGGGIYCNTASPKLSHLIIKDNLTECGGGIFLRYSSSVISNCTISGNACNTAAQDAPNVGGGIAVWNCTGVSVRNCVIKNNIVSTAGGAFYSLTSSADVVNCLVTGNHTMVMGSAFYADSYSHTNIVNCTVQRNICDDGTGIVVQSVMYFIDSAKVNVHNSVFYDNQPPFVVAQFNYSRNEITVSHTDLEGGVDSIFTNNGGNNITINWLNGNMDTLPMFVNPAQNDFHLLPVSPCINTGDTAGLGFITSLDLDNQNRFYGVIDMGCYEYQGPAGMQLENAIDQIKVYPNPANDYVFIDFGSFVNNDALFSVTDVSGRLVTVIRPGNNEVLRSIDVSSWARGMYYLNIRCRDKNKICKIIISH